MHLGQVQRFFGDKYRSDRAGDFYGQLMALSTEVANSYFNAPRRLIKVDADTRLRAGHVVQDKSGNSYISTNHGASELFGRTLYRTFRLYEITHPEALWVTKTTYKDDITGLNRDNREIKARIPAVIEFQKSQEDEMRIPSDLVRIIVRDEVSVGDVVDAYHIVNIEHQMGVKIATARRQ